MFYHRPQKRYIKILKTLVYELGLHTQKQAAIGSSLRKINLIYFHPTARVYRRTVDAIYSDGQSKGLRAVFSFSLFLLGAPDDAFSNFLSEKQNWATSFRHLVLYPFFLFFFWDNL